MCRTLAAGRLARSCKLPARLKEYVLPGQKHGACKDSTRHQTVLTCPASHSADELAVAARPIVGQSKQRPSASITRIIVKLSGKASGTGQGRVPQVQTNQTSPATLQQPAALPSDHAPLLDVPAHLPISRRAISAKPLRAALVERPVTRRFSLQQRSKLKLRIKLKRTATIADQQPQRMSTLKHQQKRQQASDSATKHDISLPTPAALSAAPSDESASSKLPVCVQMEPHSASQLGTAVVVASGSAAQYTAQCSASSQPVLIDGYSRLSPLLNYCNSSNTVTAADAQPITVATNTKTANVCSSSKSLVPLSRGQHGSPAATAKYVEAGSPAVCTDQKHR